MTKVVTKCRGAPMCHFGRRVVWPRVNGTVGDWHLAVPTWTPQRKLLQSVQFVALSSTEKMLLQHMYPMYWGMQVKLKTTRRTFVECAVLYYNPLVAPDSELEQAAVSATTATLDQVGV